MKHSVHRRIASRPGLLSFAVAVVCALLAAIPVGAVSGDTLDSNGGPATPFPQNKQNEPALAVDANHPNVLVAGANDEIDLGPCFDRDQWMQGTPHPVSVVLARSPARTAAFPQLHDGPT